MRQFKVTLTHMDVLRKLQQRVIEFNKSIVRYAIIMQQILGNVSERSMVLGVISDLRGVMDESRESSMLQL